MGPGAVAVVGGAGYIGAHVVHALAAAGREVVIIDDLSTGRWERVGSWMLHRIDISAPACAPAIARALDGCSVVVHLAAHKEVEESVLNPLRYYGDNLTGLGNVIEAMREAEVKALVLSSSAAVYAPSPEPVAEGDPTAPANPYGRSKVASEWLVADAARAYGFATASLRYFNVAGAANEVMADRGGASLLPQVARAFAHGRVPHVYGTDYDTPDGSAVRDFVHVADVARAHVAVAQLLEHRSAGNEILNVGTGRGVSVIEVVESMAREVGCDPTFIARPRRPGDIPFSTARVDRIADLTGWRAERTLDEMVADVWRLRDVLGRYPRTGRPTAAHAAAYAAR